ncbi:MAG: hypothetical protein K5978_07150 [Campylobacter sp.]|nr:hypothetical protein [Campylobacter sp.]
MKWWQQNEKGGVFWLNLSLFLVAYLPKFLVKFLAVWISLFYFLFFAMQRKAICKFYENLYLFKNGEKLSFFKKYFLSYINFYEFALAICDKIALWKDKIKFDSIVIKDESYALALLKNQQKGKVILTSHFGNVEIARGFEEKLGSSKIYILMYGKNTQKFIDFMNKVSSKKINILLVEELDIQNILQLEKIIQNGDHIGIMGDRTSISNSKNARIKFLGKECEFPQGAFYLAHILKSQLVCLNCIKNLNKYEISVKALQSDKEQKQAKVDELLAKYVEILEKEVCEKPKFWFNFYDFWGQDDK